MKRGAIAVLVFLVGTVTVGVAAETASHEETLEGQVACAACWFEADRAKVPYGGPGDLACAERCAKDGIPQALAVERAPGVYELWTLESGSIALDERGFLPWIGARVKVRGRASREGDSRRLAVDAIEGIVESRPAAALTLPDLSGIPQSLEALRGRVVVLNFWATWCKPCREEMPLLARLQDRFGIRGVQFVGASADAVTEADAVTRFAVEARMNFPVWLGAATDDMERLGLAPALPGTIVIDRDGLAVARFSGIVSEIPLSAAITRALGIRDVPPKAGSEPVEPRAGVAEAPVVATTVSRYAARGTSRSGGARVPA